MGLPRKEKKTRFLELIGSRRQGGKVEWGGEEGKGVGDIERLNYKQ